MMNSIKIVKSDDANTSLHDRQYAKNTLKSHAHWNRIWCEWCKLQRITPFPAHDTNICGWLKLNSSHYKFSSLKLFIAMLCFYHRREGYSNPITEKVEWTLVSIARQIGIRKHQAEAITEDDWVKLCAYFKTQNSLASKRNFAMLSLMRACMLRVSEVLQIRENDVKDDMLLVRRSKTDQFGEGEELFIPPAYRQVVYEWIDIVYEEFSSHCYLFVPIHRYNSLMNNQAISAVAATKIIKQSAHSAGICKEVSGHSFRVGMAQSLAEFGCGLPEIQNAGRWKSPTMPGYYIRNIEKKKGAIAKYHESKKYD